MNDTLEITTLGGLEIRVGGEPVTGFYSRKVEALLVYLACTGRPQPRDVLADLLWDEVTQSRALGNLRVVLHNLREKLGPYVEITRTTVGLNEHSDPSTSSGPGQAVWLDITELQAKLDIARERGGSLTIAAAEQVTDAVSLYQGDFLAGFYVRDCPRFEDWQLVEQERLRNLVVGALNRLVSYYGDGGACDAAVLYSRRLLELDPLLEEAHRQVMECLACSGQRRAARAQYETCRQVLEEELGVEPEPETTALYEAILAGEVVGSSQDPAERVHNLPAQLTPFVGRKDELAQLQRLLMDTDMRLVTLAGAGGTGKTRLALEAAEVILTETQRDLFEHGVFFIPLAALRSAAGIVSALAEVLGFTFYEGGGQQGKNSDEEQLLDYLRSRRLLLLMDNFEHLLVPFKEGKGGAELVTDLLASAPSVKILATSRGRLNVHGEQLFPLAGMAFPTSAADQGDLEEASQYSAIQLFLQSARRVRPDFELIQKNAGDVVRICRLLGGMPLGILLAATWVEMLSASGIADQITRSIDFLETDEGGVPERQRSVRATFDYSWQLLCGRERDIMAALSVFRGTFTWEAAQAVAGVSLPELRMLVNRSLLHSVPSATAGAEMVGRYEVHELLRQYARQKLGATAEAAAAAHDEHCAYYAAILERFAADLKGARQGAALAEMRADGENARAAWDWMVSQRQVERLDQATEGVCRFYHRRGRLQEGEAACRVAAEALSGTENSVGTDENGALATAERKRVLGKVLTWQGAFTYWLGCTDTAEQLVRNGLALLRETAVAEKRNLADRAWAVLCLGVVRIHPGFDDDAVRLREQSLALYRAAEDEWGTALLLGALGVMARESGAYDRAKRLGEESLALRRAVNDGWGTAAALDALGWIANARGQPEEAERRFREAVVIHQEIGTRGTVLIGTLFSLSWTLIQLGRFSEAHSVAQEALERCEDTGIRFFYPWASWNLGEAKLHLGDYEGARTQLQSGLDLLQESGEDRFLIANLAAIGSVSVALEAYPESCDYLEERITQVGEVQSWRVNYELAVALTVLAYAAHSLRQTAKARKYLCRALRPAMKTQNVFSGIQVLSAAALIMADATECAETEAVRAVELYALVSRYPLVANSRWYEDVVGKHIAAVAETLPPDEVAAAQDRGRALDLWETAEELLEGLHAPD